jgi:hypothetical protein
LRPGVPGTTRPPAGCQQAEAAIKTYNQTAGSTWYGKEVAATRAGNELDTAYETAYDSGASSAVSSDLSALIQDFTFLQQNAIEGDSSGFEAVAAQANVDTQTLETDCSTG